MSNIDIQKYFGFRTLKDLKPFQQVAQNTDTLINAGEIPLEHSNFTTIIRNQHHNKNQVIWPNNFFDVARMDIAYGDTVAPGGLKFALAVVDRKTRYDYFFHLPTVKVQLSLLLYNNSK